MRKIYQLLLKTKLNLCCHTTSFSSIIIMAKSPDRPVVSVPLVRYSKDQVKNFGVTIDSEKLNYLRVDDCNALLFSLPKKNC